jgi:16S rRNA A1518/A1519 N6-dimethyltransferase RsmA/KsgA/DIM1 with predicted DNA glycosylase/AP lyase activity
MSNLDKYYTKPDVVDMCYTLFTEHICVLSIDLIIEPSCGNGAFAYILQAEPARLICYDIAPEMTGTIEVITQDYLTVDVPQNYNDIHVIGNPPYGRQCAMAIKFIRNIHIIHIASKFQEGKHAAVF